MRASASVLNGEDLASLDCFDYESSKDRDLVDTDPHHGIHISINGIAAGLRNTG